MNDKKNIKYLYIIMDKEKKKIFLQMRKCIRDAAMIAKTDYSTFAISQDIAFEAALFAISHYTKLIAKNYL